MDDIIEKYFNNIEEETREYIIGIDLGTCNSCCSIWRNNTSEIIPDEYGNRTIPSFVTFTNKTTYIGIDSKNQSIINTENTFYEVKRLIGKKYKNNDVTNDKKFLSYEIFESDDDSIIMKYKRNDEEHKITPEEITSMILMKLKNLASDYLKTPITKAVITVPAYFTDSQRQATIDAAKIIGLECVRLMSEPVSSALAYGLNKITKENSKESHIVVFDLGGGTLDVSLLSIENGLFQVIGSSGNTHLGGVDFDNKIYSYCVNYFKHKNKFDSIEISMCMMQQLKKSCENAKKILSNSQSTIICVPNFYNSLDLLVPLSREKFQELCNDLTLMCIESIDNVLSNCNIQKKDIDEIILVGGMTRTPIIRENIKNYFNKCPNSSINPDEIVAVGASIQGYMISQQSDPLLDSIMLLDSTVMSLGVETIGGVMSIVIPRGSIIPTSSTCVYSNDTSNETSVLIKIYEGERKLTKNNYFVGDFELSGLDKAPIGYHKIEVTFNIDIDGLITVTAKDLRKNNSNEIRICGNRGRLTTENIQKMIETSKQYEQDDKINKKKIKLRHEIGEMCENIKNNLSTMSFVNLEKNMIDAQLDKVNTHLAKSLDDVTCEECEKIASDLKEKYIVLIVSDMNKKNPSIESYTTDSTNVGTSVFQNEDDVDYKQCMKIVANELGYEEMNETELNELKQTRNDLIDLCNNILNIINSSLFNTLNVDETKKNLLKEYADETLVWIYVQPKITQQEYCDKINKLTEMSNECIQDTTTNSTDETSQEDELKLLCESLENCMNSNIMISEDNNLEKLRFVLNETKIWMSEFHTIEEYTCKIKQINDLCEMISSELKIKN